MAALVSNTLPDVELAQYVGWLKVQLKNVSTEQKAQASRRYFPKGIKVVGANVQDIKQLIKTFHHTHHQLTPEHVLEVSEQLLASASFSEEVMVAFGLINKYVKKHYDDELLTRFKYWLETYANNWALVDDLCMKSLFNFLLARPYLIEKTQPWSHSEISWCRRASNVAWVKFIRRPIGRDIYYLNPKLVFENCETVMADADEFVQKSIGWLLKVTAIHHKHAVVNFIRQHYKKMPRTTIRYALEKIPTEERVTILKECS